MDLSAKLADGNNMLRRGFTFPELIIVFGMIIILMGFITLGVVPSQRRTSLSEISSVLVADSRQQQLKAMQGTSPSGAGSAFGIYFSSDSYILFRGTTFNPADSENFEVSLDPGFVFTQIDFPGSVLVFNRGSGEVGGFVDDTYDLVLSDDQSSSFQTITFNRYGAITQIN